MTWEEKVKSLLFLAIRVERYLRLHQEIDGDTLLIRLAFDEIRTWWDDESYLLDEIKARIQEAAAEARRV